MMTGTSPTDGLAPAPGLYPEPAFIGWRRGHVAGRSTRWVPVCGGETERECWQRLSKLIDTAAGHNDSVILPRGTEP